MRLTRRGRNTVRATAVLSLMVVIGAGYSAVGNATEKPTVATPASVGYVRVVVAPGETLWSLANLVAGSASVSSVVDEISKANDLKSADIHAGEKLWVPAN
ncbi:MAG: LysM peptidoglycan-binding domain-containing protein [Actinomycetes bacterium]|jgi:LysM repeat protein